MAEYPSVERLTPLDSLMPNTYIRALFTFATTESPARVSARLQHGLDHLVQQLPWISGRIVPRDPTKGNVSEIHFDSNIVPQLVDKGLITLEYKELCQLGMPPDAIPDAVDADGFAALVRRWVQSCKPSDTHPMALQGRNAQLLNALSGDLAAILPVSRDDLLARHPEYSSIPSSFPTEFPSCTSKVFTIPMVNVNAIKAHLPASPSTNTVLCALLWTAITRARHSRNPLIQTSSRLAMAVNGRRRISTSFSTPEDPYMGNVILYSLANLPVHTLVHQSQSPEIYNAIAQFAASSRINARHIAEVYRLADCSDHLHVGWDLFSSCNLTITSWADLGLYEMDFGGSLGRPTCIRVPYTEADGVGLILPAKNSDDTVEVMVMLRRDDMNLLEKDRLWKSVVAVS
ncbi:hypothetical protein ASPWEDRAFT_178031 [Aspergillus wentii DTO 134E9]|uniref:Uncharacterized protein n=1 Tax=Aspergillus wentii DTO 134E9 TaxID=1073089 RepID=A0A1L9RYW4_ASPWE|nr:uncharacterized protein ASPWEDRAFT_178031 [Aspergillus wentii DTO 134E9]OJJ40141.1 hypothetical protein ASPWEDRAFT_178031 [Aspergillus wentii DTO 134E9]